MPGDDALDHLPPELPADLRAFLECTGDATTIANGPIQWLEIPANVRGLLGGASQAALEMQPGPAPASALVKVRAGWVSATLTATIVGGRLTIDSLKLPMLAPRSIATAIEDFVSALNTRLAANGKALAPPSFGTGGMTLTKIDSVE
jgi:hypothetical protein